MDNFRPTGSLLPGQFYIDPNTDAGKKILELQAELESLRQGGREHIYGDSEKGKHEIVLLREQLKEREAQVEMLANAGTQYKDWLSEANEALRTYYKRNGYMYDVNIQDNTAKHVCRTAIERALQGDK